MTTDKIKLKKYGHGGARPGSGRPMEDGNENSRVYTFRAGGEIGQFLDSLDNRTEYFKDCVRRSIRESHFPVLTLKQRERIMIPMYDLRVACGSPVDLDNSGQAEMVEILEEMCPHPENCYMIKVNGESMKNIGIHSGDTVIIDRTQRKPSPDEVAMCELNGEYTLKHFVREGDHGWLVPENENFMRIKVEPTDEFHVWGVVKTVIHNM